jgi:hypothetical protein
MAFNWRDYFALAQALAAANGEASKRTSVSRAYYFVFHLALERAERNCGAREGGNTHQWCWDRYIYTHNNDACNQIGIDGNRLKGRRVTVDYDSAPINRLDDFVRRMLEDVEQLERDLNNLPPQFPQP